MLLTHILILLCWTTPNHLTGSGTQPFQSFIMKMRIQTYQQTIGWKNLFQLKLFFPHNSSLCQIDINHHRKFCIELKFLQWEKRTSGSNPHHLCHHWSLLLPLASGLFVDACTREFSSSNFQLPSCYPA